MNVLIITPTKAEYDRTIQTYSEQDRQHNTFHHITKKEQMHGFRMPVRIRFVGSWWELDDAPTLEYYAQHIISAPVTEEHHGVEN